MMELRSCYVMRSYEFHVLCLLKMRHIRAFFYVMSLRLALLSNSLLALFVTVFWRRGCRCASFAVSVLNMDEQQDFCNPHQIFKPNEAHG